MPMKTNNIKIRYLLIGLITGLILWLLFFSLCIISLGMNLNLAAFFELHIAMPAVWVVHITPFVLATMLFFIGKRFENMKIKANRDLSKYKEKTETIVSFTNSLRAGEIDIDIQANGENDELSQSLIDLRDNLKKSKEEEEKRRKEDAQRNWATEGLAMFGEILRKDNDNLETLSFNVISKLVKYLKANQGGFFVLNDDEEENKFFELTACYAYDRKKYLVKKIEWGEGLVGTCALDKKFIYITDVPQNYIAITSGLGGANPNAVILVPLIVNDNLYGVLEIASFNPFEEFEINFLEKLAESIASTIATTKTSIQTNRLLVETQKQAEIMAMQDKEMRQNMEELRVTQEQAAMQGAEFENFTTSVNHTLIRAEFNTEGTLLYANTRYINTLEYFGNRDVEGKHISLFIDRKDKEWFDPIWDRLAKGGTHFEGDMKMITRAGKEVWIMGTFVCMRSKSQTVEKILFLGMDITDKKKLNLDYQGQIQALNQTVLKAEFSLTGKILDCNENLLLNTGYRMSDLNNESVYFLLEEKDYDTFRDTWSNLLMGQPFQGEIKLKGKEGKKFYETAFTPVHDMYGEMAKIILTATDITEKKKMEMEMQQQNDLLTQQTKQLQEQEEELKQSEIELSKKLDKALREMKDQFREIEMIKEKNEKTLEGFLDAIVSFNHEGTIEFFNKAAEELWEFGKSEVIGRPIRMLFSEADVTGSDFVARMVDPSSPKVVGDRKEVNITNNNDESLSVLILLSEAEVGGKKSYTAFIQNISVDLF